MNKKERVLNAINALLGIDEKVNFGFHLHSKAINSIKNEIKYSDEVFAKKFHGKYRVDVSYQEDKDIYYYCLNKRFLWFYYTMNYRDLFLSHDFQYVSDVNENSSYMDRVALFTSMEGIFSMAGIEYEYD